MVALYFKLLFHNLLWGTEKPWQIFKIHLNTQKQALLSTATFDMSIILSIATFDASCRTRQPISGTALELWTHQIRSYIADDCAVMFVLPNPLQLRVWRLPCWTWDSSLFQLSMPPVLIRTLTPVDKGSGWIAEVRFLTGTSTILFAVGPTQPTIQRLLEVKMPERNVTTIVHRGPRLRMRRKPPCVFVAWFLVTGTSTYLTLLYPVLIMPG
jgi:hypothetical protein